jgi:Bacterial aa3 type cytochrome c oxidase subunit IV
MADHGEVQYATADGNDIPAHEAGYEQFVLAAIIGTNYVINLLIGLTIGGVLGHWLPAAAIIIAATIVLAAGLWSGSRIAGIVMLAIAALTLLVNAYS